MEDRLRAELLAERLAALRSAPRRRIPSGGPDNIAVDLAAVFLKGVPPASLAPKACLDSPASMRFLAPRGVVGDTVQGRGRAGVTQLGLVEAAVQRRATMGVCCEAGAG